MKKIIVPFIIGVVITNFSFAQTKENSSQNNFTLKQCIEYALKNQSAIKNATLDELIAAAKVKEVRGMGLPQVDGSVQFVNNNPLRRMFFDPNNPFAKTFQPPGSPPSDEKVIAIPNAFSLTNSGDAGLSISQLLFSSSYIVGLQAASAYKDLSVKATEQTKNQIIEAVTKAYYLVVINEERLKFFDNNVARIDSLLGQTKALNKNGFVEKIDVDRLQVTFNNLLTEKAKFNNLLSLGTLLLKYQMSMPLDCTLVLTEKISDFKVESIVPNSQKINATNRVEYSLLESKQTLQLLELKNYKLAYLPRVAAFANLGEFSQSPKFDFFTKKNLWYGYAMYGLSIHIPVFDGLQNTYKMRQTKLNIQKTENDLSNMALALELQIKVSETNLTNSLATLESQKNNMQLADEIARVTKIKYREGVGTSLEVISAETALLESQTNYYNALFDALNAKVDFDKAKGILLK